MECDTEIYYGLPSPNKFHRVNRTLKTTVASYVGLNHHQWDQHLNEFRFSLNSSLQESTGVTSAELNLNRLLRGSLDMVLHPRDIDPDTAMYNNISQLQDLKDFMKANLNQARLRQKRNYDLHRRDLSFKVNDEFGYVHTYSQKLRKKFLPNLLKWKGSYRIICRMGP